MLMRDFEITVDIDAPPSLVFDVMTDVERWHEWTESITRIELLDGAKFEPGARARVRQPKFPPAVWTVVSVKQDHGFTWTSGAPGMRVTGKHYVVPRGTGSQVTLSVSYDGLIGAAFAKATEGITNRYIALEAAGLKKRSESVKAKSLR